MNTTSIMYQLFAKNPIETLAWSCQQICHGTSSKPASARIHTLLSVLCTDTLFDGSLGVLKLLYTSLVQSKLPNCSQLWHPHLNKGHSSIGTNPAKSYKVHSSQSLNQLHVLLESHLSSALDDVFRSITLMQFIFQNKRILYHLWWVQLGQQAT